MFKNKSHEHGGGKEREEDEKTNKEITWIYSGTTKIISLYISYI